MGCPFGLAPVMRRVPKHGPLGFLRAPACIACGVPGADGTVPSPQGGHRQRGPLLEPGLPPPDPLGEVQQTPFCQPAHWTPGCNDQNVGGLFFIMQHSLLTMHYECHELGISLFHATMHMSNNDSDHKQNTLSMSVLQIFSKVQKIIFSEEKKNETATTRNRTSEASTPQTRTAVAPGLPAAFSQFPKFFFYPEAGLRPGGGACVARRRPGHRSSAATFQLKFFGCRNWMV